MATRRPVILIDLPPHHRRSFLDDELVSRLAAVGEVRDLDREWSGPDLRLAADAVVTGWASKRLPDRLADADRLRLVAHTGGTVRFLVPRRLIDAGVTVTQTSSAMAPAVAELCLVQTITLLRRLPAIGERMRQRDWSGAIAIPPGRSLQGMHVGVIGASRVGRAYIAAVRALGGVVSVYDPYLADADARRMGVKRAGLGELLAGCPVVALHAPVTEATRGMLDARRLATIADDGILINTARSALIDTAALVAELRSGRLSAALDVFDVEPLAQDDPLWSLPNVLLTPHRGAATAQTSTAMGEMAVTEIERFFRGEPPIAPVSASIYDTIA
ncbi:hydroxyacid dehydrogenase [Microbacterium sp. SSW1-59]|uniref:hydroxyacid dehydrogenase n=1 Tax=Microbacterium xanthum TaxID=3079794 RepID=UPI002AD3A7C0|nr:hydroxyacid dehydrogenase [Microbacterium sp. SSW1-59]MDZ8200348.1 hydroxyacid dehydrogenase [Microbacterium sp. SSW1-59]